VLLVDVRSLRFALQSGTFDWITEPEDSVIYRCSESMALRTHLLRRTYPSPSENVPISFGEYGTTRHTSLLARKEENMQAHFLLFSLGEVSEWSIEHAWKACVLETVPRVRIPPSPPIQRVPACLGLFVLMKGMRTGSTSVHPARKVAKSKSGIA
jgi:hypothetical protein